MSKTIEIKNDENYKWYETLWYYSKRFLRSVVPQLPSIYAYTEGSEYAPVFVAVGGLLTVADKFIRSKGWY